MKPQNLEERLIWYFMLGTYGLYFLALLYPLNSLLAWILLFFLVRRIWNQSEETPIEKRINIPWALWLWVVCMLVMAIATVIGTVDYDLGIKATVRGLLNWTRDWALLALFPLIGCLNIRPQLIYRAVCIVCLQSLVFIPLCYLAYSFDLPSTLYSSPVERLTQNGPIFFDVNLYSVDYESQQPRLFLFAPWGPALGLLGNIYFYFALQEPDKKWRCFGIAGATAMCVVSVSRLAIVSLPLVPIIVWVLTNLTRPTTYIIVGLGSFLSGIFSTTILGVARDFQNVFQAVRPSSSRVHEALGRIAFERWQEAPLWGHGIQEMGSKVVAGMPIGSHHTWIGLLFTKGLVGFIALLLPVLWSFIDLLIKAQKSANAKAALSFLLTLLLFTFNDSQEVLAYLYWPGLIIMGIALKGEVQAIVPLDKSPKKVYV